LAAQATAFPKTPAAVHALTAFPLHTLSPVVQCDKQAPETHWPERQSASERHATQWPEASSQRRPSERHVLSLLHGGLHEPTMHSAPAPQSSLFVHSAHSPRARSQIVFPPSATAQSKLFLHFTTPPDAPEPGPASRDTPPDPRSVPPEPPLP
jgi:hypothetical protein